MAIDWKNPDFTAIINERRERLQKLRSNPKLLEAAKIYYRSHTAEFITDWATTVDPRVIADGRNPVMPFILFPKQVELVHWIDDRFRNKESGVVVKSRDVGASWVAMAYACTVCLFNTGMTIGMGSALEIKLDRSGDPNSLFYKGRQFLKLLPKQFTGDWDAAKHSPYMRILFPDTNSSITGEAGDSIGRGGRTAIYFIDESAHIERPALIDASLAATTNCRIDMSSVNGTANSFAEKAHSGRVARFDFAWRDDPRKDDAWYQKQVETIDPVTLAQEVDCNFSASVDSVVIPSNWVQAAVDAHVKLGWDTTGSKFAGLDVADEGADKNALAIRHGNVLLNVESWSGKGSDIFATTVKTFHLCQEWGVDAFAYDKDGLGAGVAGDAKVVNEKRKVKIRAEPYRGSEKPLFPTRKMVPGRTNEDFFLNRKAQAWWNLRFMFQETWRARQGLPHDPNKCISIKSGFREQSRLLMELSQPTYMLTTAGKIQIEKAPDGATSPNLADAVCIAYAPLRPPMRIAGSLLE
jgi:hypothetical protein